MIQIKVIEIVFFEKNGQIEMRCISCPDNCVIKDLELNSKICVKKDEDKCDCCNKKMTIGGRHQKTFHIFVPEILRENDDDDGVVICKSCRNTFLRFIASDEMVNSPHNLNWYKEKYQMFKRFYEVEDG